MVDGQVIAEKQVSAMASSTTVFNFNCCSYIHSFPFKLFLIIPFPHISITIYKSICLNEDVPMLQDNKAYNIYI